MSIETREKISKTLIGKKFSEKTCQNISKAAKDRVKRDGAPMSGKHHSEETKHKISESNKKLNKTLSEEHRQKLREVNSGANNHSARAVKCLNTGEVFDTITAAGLAKNADRSHIVKCCKGKAITCGKDKITGESLRWEYID